MSLKVGELFGVMGIDDSQFDRKLDKGKKSFEKVSDIIETPMMMKVDELGLAKSVEKAKSKVEELSKEMATKSKLGVDTSQLTLDLAKAKAEMRSAVKALDNTVRLDADTSKAKTAVGDVKGMLDRIDGTTATAKVDVDTSGVDDGAAEGEQKLVDMIGGWAVAGPAAAAGLGIAIGMAFLDAFNTVLENGKTNDLLSARLGLNEAEAEKAGRVTSQVYLNAWGESMADVADAVDAVGSTLVDFGSTGEDQLTKLTTRALDLGAVLDETPGKVVNSVGILKSSGWVYDAEHGFDLIAAASARMPAEMRGDLLEATDEYGQFFQALGFSAEQGFGVLVEGSKKGMYGIDKAGDSIKEFTIRATDMSSASVAAYDTLGLSAEDMSNKILAGGETAKGAFDQIVTGLLSIEDPTKRANTAIALFGTPIEDLGVNGIPAFLTSLLDANTGLGDVATAADDASATLNGNLATSLDSIKRKLDPATLLQAFEDGGFDAVKDQVSQAITEIGALWDQYGPEVRAAFDEAKEDISAWWDENGPAIIEDISAWWSETGSPALGEVLSTALGAALSAGWESFKAGAAEKISDPDYWIELIKLQLLGPLSDGIMQTGQELPERTTEMLTPFARSVAEGFLNAAWDGVSSFKMGLGRLAEVASMIPGTVTGAIGDLGGLLRDAGNRIIGGLIEGIKSRIQDLKNLLGTITDLIPNLKGPPEKDAKLLFGAGQLVMGGFIGGIESQEAALRAHLGRVTSMTAGMGMPIDMAGGSQFPGGVTGSASSAGSAHAGRPLELKLVLPDGRVLAEASYPHLRVIERRAL